MSACWALALCSHKLRRYSERRPLVWTHANKPISLTSRLNLVNLLSNMGSHWRQKWVQYQFCRSYCSLSLATSAKGGHKSILKCMKFENMPSIAFTAALGLVQMEAEASCNFVFFAAHAPQPHPNYKQPHLLLPYVSSFPVFKNKMGTLGCTIRIFQIQIIGYLPSALNEDSLLCSLGAELLYLPLDN